MFQSIATANKQPSRAWARRPITRLAQKKVGSHYHFIEANKELRFDRRRSYGKRLHILAGAAVRFEPGDTKTVTLVDIAGRREVRGGNGERRGLGGGGGGGVERGGDILLRYETNYHTTVVTALLPPVL